MYLIFSCLLLLSLSIWGPPRTTRNDTLLPYTKRYRSTTELPGGAQRPSARRAKGGSRTMQRDFGIDHIRAELTARITAIDLKADRLTAGALASELDEVRRIAQTNGRDRKRVVQGKSVSARVHLVGRRIIITINKHKSKPTSSTQQTIFFIN